MTPISTAATRFIWSEARFTDGNLPFIAPSVPFVVISSQTRFAVLDYSFKIYCNLYEYENFYSVNSNIPDFNVANVTWTVTPADIKWNKAPEGAYVTSTVDCTITASYVYNGRTYTDSMRQTMDQVKYTFNIVPVYPVTGDRLVFRIETNIPNFNAANVQWSPGPAAVTGWVEGGQYVIDRTSLSANISYWLNATYFYNGLNYTSDISISSDQ